MKLKLTSQRFFAYQKTFYENNIGSPMDIGLRITDVGAADDLESFVGSSERSYKDYFFKGLYEKTTDPYERTKEGLSKTRTATVYLSPLQLIPIFGTYKLDRNKTKVIFEGRPFIIDKISYQEPLFDSCIAVELTIKLDYRG